MTGEHISHAIGNISPRHIEEAADFQTRRPSWQKFAVAAACFCLVFAAIGLSHMWLNQPEIPSIQIPPHSSTGKPVTNSTQNPITAPTIGSTQKPTTTPPTFSTPVPTVGSSSVTVPPLPTNGDVIINMNMFDVMSQFALSAKLSSEIPLSTNSISVELSYGLLEGCSPGESTDIRIYAENSKQQTHMISSFPAAQILGPEYTVQCIWDSNREWITGFQFTHSETIELPTSLFSGESGRVWIVLQEYWETDYGSGASIMLHYTRTENSILITAAPA